MMVSVAGPCIFSGTCRRAQIAFDYARDATRCSAAAPRSRAVSCAACVVLVASRFTWPRCVLNSNGGRSIGCAIELDETYARVSCSQGDE